MKPGKKSAKVSKPTLQQLCADHANVIAQMVDLLHKMNIGRGDPIGTCCPWSGAPCFACTKIECDSVPGDWHEREPIDDPDSGDDPDPEFTKKQYELATRLLLLHLPETAKQYNQLCASNPEVAHQLSALLNAANKDQRGDPIGIFRLPDGSCKPGTKKECDAAGGIWSSIVHPGSANRSQSRKAQK